MAKGTKTKTSEVAKNSGWRKFFVGLLILLACVATAAGTFASWVQPLIFNTDKWIDTVGPLPKDPAIANAVATDTVDALFESQNVEQVITDSLPERAQFLAGPLSDQIRTEATKLATQFVQGDKFSEIWTGANRVAHSQFVKIIERPAGQSKLEQAASKAETVSLDLAGVQEQVRKQLGISGEKLFDPAQLKAADGFAVDLKEQVQEIRETADLVDRLHRGLPFIALALFLASLAVSRSRRTTLLAVGISIMATSAVLLIVLKTAKPEVTGLAAQSINQQALAAAWEQVTKDLHSAIAWLMLPGALVALVGILAGPYAWAVKLRELVGLPKLQQTGVAKGWNSFRNTVDVRLGWFRGGGIVIVVAALLIAQTVVLGTVIAAIAAAVAYLSLVELVRTPAR
jgi:hypothetical protein